MAQSAKSRGTDRVLTDRGIVRRAGECKPRENQGEPNRASHPVSLGPSHLSVALNKSH
jgi:hypothetical protein